MDANKVVPSETGGTMNDDATNTVGKRLIGVFIVVGLTVIGLLLWIRIGKWPRRKLRKLGCTCLPEPRSSKRKLAEEAIGGGPGVAERPGSDGHASNRLGSNRETIQTPDRYRPEIRSPEQQNTLKTAEAGSKELSSPSFTYIAKWPSHGRRQSEIDEENALKSPGQYSKV
ncbi:hypothetical protein PM082_002837 [Marasmius tenuissimus]|nr:hypothetical protein PM082_002837 [Marasmius tenuissimus]